MVGGQFSNFGAMGDYLNGRRCSQRTLSIRGTPLSALVSANFGLAGEGARPTRVVLSRADYPHVKHRKCRGEPSAVSRQQKLLVPALAYFHAALARLALQQVPLPPVAGSE